MKRKALFLDRDGVINEDVNFVGTVERFAFKQGIFAFLRAVQSLGYRLVVVTNQSGVARGLYTATDHETVTAHMLAALAHEGITIDAVETCYHHKDGTVPPYNRASFWRKPNAGMILDAAQRLGIDLTRSAMIGDREGDMLAAQNAGIPVRLLLSASAALPEGAARMASFDEALAFLKKA
ncbi:MAG: HAD family hydrolase [Bdellovibrionales bacterium]|jgi:D-glycero-D-manno-heptose 1,7-bisphosphate phosphatase